MERVGIIDLGSNSARLVIFQIFPNHAYNMIYDLKESVRLSEGISPEGMLQDRAMNDGIDALNLFQKLCRRYSVTKLIAVATAAVRSAPNGSIFLERIKKETGLSFRLLSGDEEAYYGYLGIVNTLGKSNYLQFDLGGGSIELVWVRNRKNHRSVSLPFGAVTLTDKFDSSDQLTEKNKEKLFKWLGEQWKEVGWLEKTKNLPVIGTGGTMRNLAKIDQRRTDYPFRKLHSYQVSRESLKNIWSDLTTSTNKERKKWSGLNPERTDLISAGGAVIFSLAELVDTPRLIVSGSGIREGLFFEYYREMMGKPAVIRNNLWHSTENLARFYHLDRKHSQRVRLLVKKMFRIVENPLAFKKRDLDLLQTSAFLHDLGVIVNYYNHARHSAYMIENSELYGLTHKEQIFCSVLAAWHSGSTQKQVKRYYSQFLNEEDWLKARQLGLILAISEVLEEEQPEMIRDIEGEIIGNELDIRLIFKDKIKLDSRLLKPLVEEFKKETGLTIAFHPHQRNKKEAIDN